MAVQYVTLDQLVPGQLVRIGSYWTEVAAIAPNGTAPADDPDNPSAPLTRIEYVDPLGVKHRHSWPTGGTLPTDV